MYINYLLGIIISYTGLFCGIALAYIAEEELKLGKKHLIILRDILFFAILLIFTYFSLTKFITLNLYAVLFCLIYFVLLKAHRTANMYLILGLIMYLSYNNLTLFTLLGSLVFILGLPVGTLITSVTIKSGLRDVIKKVITITIGYLVIAGGLQLIP